MTHTDNAELKERERSNWASVAEGWGRRDDLLRRGAAPVTERMLELSGITSGSRLLDIASGTGEPALSAARIIGESGTVTGIDLADEMLVIARRKSRKANFDNIKFHCADAETLDFATGSFDAVTIRWGLMFMPEPQACLAAAYKALKPNGSITLACWAAPEKNPFVGVLMKTLKRFMDIPVPPPGTPGIFAFSDPEYLRKTIASAGFKHIALEEMSINVIEVDDGRAYWEAISDMAAPVMALVRKLAEPARSDYINAVIKVADTMKQGETLCMKGTTWIASAVKQA